MRIVDAFCSIVEFGTTIEVGCIYIVSDDCVNTSVIFLCLHNIECFDIIRTRRYLFLVCRVLQSGQRGVVLEDHMSTLVV